MQEATSSEAEPTTLDDIARANLQRIVDEDFGSITAAAHAMNMARPTLSKVLSGDSGFNNLREWTARMIMIGREPLELFGLPTKAGMAVALARRIADLPEAYQLNLQAQIEVVEAMLEGKQPELRVPDRLRAVLELGQQLPPERIETLVAVMETWVTP